MHWGEGIVGVVGRRTEDRRRKGEDRWRKGEDTAEEDKR